MTKLDKLAENDSLDLLAAYIKTGRPCSDDEAYEGAYTLCDQLDSILQEINLPPTYAVLEYDDFDDPEAIDGARWDDMNYLHYMER